MGTKSGWPNFFTSKFLITDWVEGATMKSANALPPAVLIFGPFAGFTPMRIEVQQASVALNQNRQRQPVEEGQVSPAVADRVGASVIGNVERRPHSLTRLNVPSSFWRNTGGLPEGFFETVGAGIITPGDKRRM